MTVSFRWSPCLLLLGLVAPSLDAQQRSSATYVVSREGREGGQERITRGTSRAGTPELRVDATPVDEPPVTAVLTQASGSELDVLQLEVRHPEGAESVRAAPGPGRVLVSVSGTGTRRAREIPASGSYLLLDESAHGLLLAAADRATPEGASLQGIYVRTGRRVRFTATRSTASAAGQTTVRLAGDLEGQIVLDADGRMLRLELPGARIRVERLPD